MSRKYMPEQGKTHDQIRILHVLDKFAIDGESLHGVARLMSWWVNAIDLQDFELYILGLRGPTEAARHVERQGGRVFYSDRGKLSPASLLDILQIAKTTDADLLHLHGYKASTLGRIAGLVLGIPVILHEHAAFLQIPLLQKIADWLLAPFGDRVIVVSKAVEDFCVEHRSMRREQIEVIPNGVPLGQFRNVSEQEAWETANEFNLASDVPVIGTVARLEEGKGVADFLDAIPQIQETVPQVKVFVVGSGTLRSELERRARQLGVAEAVIFAGERRDVPRLYKLMDVKVIASLHEGGPLTLLEAMAAGIPVVATPVGLVEELIDDGESGVLIPRGAPEQIAEAVVSLLQNPDRRADIALRAEERVQDYDIEVTIHRIEKVYRSVLN